jgi:chemotaxis response regulator CheB
MAYPSVSLPPVVAIGASGSHGIADIKAVLSELPRDLAAAVLIVLHRPVDRPSRLSDVLGASSRLPVRVAEDGQRFRAGTCYIGEPAAHLSLGPDGVCRLIHDSRNALRNRTVDALFCSLAAYAGRRVIGIVLSGGLNDGSLGLVAIKTAGGTTMTLALTGSESGMPENAVASCGEVDVIGAPDEIARAVVRQIDGTPRSDLALIKPPVKPDRSDRMLNISP